MTTLDKETQDKLMATCSQKMALCANKNKNWRANYLRALNIVTPDLATSTRGRRVSNGEGTRRTAGQQATTTGRIETMTGRRRAVTVTNETTRRSPSGGSRRGRSGVSTLIPARQTRSGSSSRSKLGASPADDWMSTYMFGLRSHIFRSRRLASRSDLMMVDCMSAPIEIPTVGTSLTAIPSRADKLLGKGLEFCRRRESSNDFQNPTDPTQPMVQLLSWEEPSAMLGNGGWPLEIEKRNSRSTVNDMSAVSSIPMNSSRSTKVLHPDGIAEVCEDTEDEDADGLTHSEDDDDDIFKMEFDGGNTDHKLRVKRARNHTRRSDTWYCRQPDGFDKCVVDEEDDMVTPLSASFVPPHQMVERGCFSLGLRDELKRKPGVSKVVT